MNFKITDGDIQHIYDEAKKSNIKVRMVLNCFTHDNHICLHMRDFGFGTPESARIFIREARTMIQSPVEHFEVVRP